MAASGLSINAVVLTVVSLAIGLVLIGSLLAPIASDVMASLTDLGGDGGVWANMVGVCVIFSILGLVILAVNQYTKN